MTAPPNDDAPRMSARRREQPSYVDFDQLECGNVSAVGEPAQLATCRTCRENFVPIERSHKRCMPCHREWQHAREQLSRQRNRDGVIVYQLIDYLPVLRSDDPAAAAWLEELRHG